MPIDEGQVPRVPDLFAPVLKALDSLGGSASSDEINDRVADVLALTPEMRAFIHKDGPLPKVDYRCAWARSWLKNAGLVENSGRGIWAMTAEGRMALARGDERGLVKQVRQASYALRKGVTLGDYAASGSDGPLTSGQEAHREGGRSPRAFPAGMMVIEGRLGRRSRIRLRLLVIGHGPLGGARGAAKSDA